MLIPDELHFNVNTYLYSTLIITESDYYPFVDNKLSKFASSFILYSFNLRNVKRIYG